MMLDYEIFKQILLDAVYHNNLLLMYSWFDDPLDATSFVISFFCHKFSQKKTVVLAPKIELEWLKKRLSVQLDYPLSILDKKLLPEERIEQVKIASVILLTPKMLYNELLRGSILPENLALIVVFNPNFSASKKPLKQLTKIMLQSQTNFRIFGLSNTINSVEEIKEICKILNITKIECCESQKEANSISNKIQLRTVPLSKGLFEFSLELSKNIEEYVNFLEKYKITNPLNIRKRLKAFIREIKTSFVAEEQEIIIQKALELIYVLRVKELIETVGSNASLSFLQTLEKKRQSNDNANIFVSSPLYRELIEGLAELSNNLHPKFRIVKDFLEKARALKERIEIIVQERYTAEHIHDFLQNSGFVGKILLGKSAKIRKQICYAFEQGFLDFVLASQPTEKADLTIFFSLTKKFSAFTSRIHLANKTIFLITHRSLEEKVYYKFLFQEKQKKVMLDDPELKIILIKNQAAEFDRNQSKRLNPRIKALLTLKKNFANKHLSSPPEPLVKAVMFLTNLSKDKTLQLISTFDVTTISQLKYIDQNSLAQILSKTEAKEVFEVIQKRLALIT